jgi:broad specificity phosphatase PhoE
MTETIVHLLRHGEVDNPSKVLYGRMPNFYLSQLGLEMADRAANFFQDRDLVKVISSPLVRAQQTAAPTAKKLAIEIVKDPRIIEATNVFEGKRVSVGDGALKNPRNWWHLRNPWLPSWGEPYQQVAERMRQAIYAAKNLAIGKEIVLVSHQLPIYVARLAFEGRNLVHDPRKRQCSLASVTSLRFEGDEFMGVEYHEPSFDLLTRIKR